MVSAHVGVDRRVGSDILAGLAASYSSGTFDFTDRTGASPVTGGAGGSYQLFDRGVGGVRLKSLETYDYFSAG